MTGTRAVNISRVSVIEQLKRYPEASGTFRRITQEYPDTDWSDRARFELGETFYHAGGFPAGRPHL
jgi:TolA-binding protein